MTLEGSRRAWVWATVLAILAVLGFFAFRQNLDVEHFEIAAEGLPPGTQVTLVQLSDLHSSHYGTRQHGLVTAVSAADPDAVLLTGDIIDRHRPITNAIELVEEVSSRWPTYFSFGNHEFLSHDDEDFQRILEANGVIVLRGDVRDLRANGATVQIGGIDDPDVNRFRPDRDSYQRQLDRLRESIGANTPTVVLSHRPEQITELLAAAPDIVLSGHAHGGQWRIPGVLDNGAFAPGQGFLPAMTNGRFDFGATQLVVSRGLSRWAPPIPRVFNRPEIVVITLAPKTAGTDSNQ